VEFLIYVIILILFALVVDICFVAIWCGIGYIIIYLIVKFTDWNRKLLRKQMEGKK